MPHRTPAGRLLLSSAMLAALTSGSAWAAATPALANPVVIELYQSQGCSSCPPANADLNAIADRSDVLALSFAVTYWDRLGWKDTFGSPRFTARQQDYARAGRGRVATPEFIVNGTYAVVGANRGALDAAIAKAALASGGPVIAASTARIRIERAAGGAAATVWLIRYDPRTRQVPIRAGENGGRTLPHRNIVRELVKLGDWTGDAASFPRPAVHKAGLVTAVVVQRGNGGPIIAARRI